MGIITVMALETEPPPINSPAGVVARRSLIPRASNDLSTGRRSVTEF